uniref:Manganese-dependent ADP-ribose/CDP-alcohol diphosphatase n=1 Tax=Leptobrachium leishanense TaxID=445787 RepID=A0A8C5QZ90_9ANUR
MAEPKHEELDCDEEQKPHFTFGVIADVQYADSPDRLSGWKVMRYYRQSLLHLREAIAEWKKEDFQPKFVFQLGDFIDGCNFHLCESIHSLQVVLKEIENIDVPFHHIWGNHDLLNFNRDYLKETALNSWSLADRGHEELDLVTAKSSDCTDYYAYHFSPFPNFRCVVVDSFDISVHGRHSTHPKYQESENVLHGNSHNIEPGGSKHNLPSQLKEFNGGFSKEQLSWLHEVLTFSDGHNERVLLASHVPIHPKAALKSCLAWNYKDMLDLLHLHPSVVCYFAGHDHNGGFHKDNYGIYHITMEGVIESPPTANAFATVSVYSDRLVLHGRGRVKSRILHYKKESELKKLTDKLQGICSLLTHPHTPL